MHATFILDTSFLFKLMKLNGFCHHQPLDRALLPINGLDHLRQSGSALVIPNEALKSMTHNKGECVSIGMNAGRPYLDMNALKSHICHPAFHHFLIEKINRQQLVCFTSAEAFQQAEASGSLAGKVAIVAAYPVKEGNGVQKYLSARENPSAPSSHAEIMAISRGVIPDQRPWCVLNGNVRLSKEFAPYGEVTDQNRNRFTFFTRPYLTLLKECGFDPQGRLLKMADLFEQNPENPNLGQANNTHTDFKMRLFCKNSGLSRYMYDRDKGQEPPLKNGDNIIRQVTEHTPPTATRPQAKDQNPNQRLR